MNNKKLGTAFEKQVVKKLSELGAWVHFLSPDSRGAQPFDIIAVKDGFAIAVECKTQDEKSRFFPLGRLEENQVMAFEKWIACGNGEPLIFIQYRRKIKVVEYSRLKRDGKVDLDAL